MIKKILFLIVFLLVSCKKEYEAFYTLENDTISSVYKVTGLEITPKIKKTEDGKIYTFNNVTNVLYDSVKYANYLWKNEGYYITKHDNFGKENGSVELAKNSLDINKVIRINVNCYPNNSFDVIISLVNGTLKIKNNITNK